MTDESNGDMTRTAVFIDKSDLEFLQELAFKERKETPKPNVSVYIRRAVKRFIKMKQGGGEPKATTPKTKGKK